MRKHIFTLSLALTLSICAESVAQLDLENIMQESEAPKVEKSEPQAVSTENANQPVQAEGATAQANPPSSEEDKEKAEAPKTEDKDVSSPEKQDDVQEETEDEKTDAAPTEEATKESEDDDQIILPEDEPDEPKPAESNPADTTENVAESSVQDNPDDFMLQYFNDVDEAAAEDAADKAARDAAAALIRDEPTMVTIPEEQQKMLKIGEKRRQQREEKRRQIQEEQKRIQEEILAKKEAEERAIAEAKAAEEAKDPKVIAARKAEAEKQKKEQMLSSHEKAPFGLYWGLSKEQTESLGFQFKPATLDNNKNVYALINPKQQQKQFTAVFVIFGDRDHLSTVYAEGTFIKDTPQADKVLRIYDQYYTALKNKYGNEKEYFKPNKHEETLDAPAALQQTASKTGVKAKSKTITVEHPRGNENFLKELQEEKASLYAVFGNKKIKVTLSVEANEQGQTRIVLDYENLETQKSDNKDTLKDLINDL